MREDKTHRGIERKQTFLVLQNEIIGRNIIAFISASFQTAVNLMPLFIDAEISGMSLGNINCPQILLVRCVEQCKILIQYINIFLLENLAVFRVNLVAILIVAAVFCNLVNKEQR